MRWLVFTFLFTAASCSSGPEIPAVEPIVAPEPEQVPPTLAEAEEARTSGRLNLYETALLTLSRSEEESTRRRALTLLSLFFVQQERFDEAAAALQRAADEEPILRPFLLLELIKIHENQSRFDLATEVAQAIIRDHPTSSAATMASLRLPALFAAAGNREGASAALQQLAAIKFDEQIEEALLSSADSFERAGWIDLAAGLRMRVLLEYAQGRFTERTFGQLASLGPQSPLLKLTFDETIGLADRLARVNRYPQALQLLEDVVKRFPDKRTAPLLRYTRLRALFNSRNYEDVIRATRLKQKDPFFLPTELLRARSYWRTDRNDEFVQILKSILKKHPNSPEAGQAKLLLSRYYTIDERDLPRASKLLEEVIASAGLGDQGEHLWSLGWIHTLDGENEKALAAFARYIAQFPDADYTTNSLFWTGKIHERAGRIVERDAAFEQLIKTFPYAYYSYRARELLGVPLMAPAETTSGFAFPVIDGEENDRLQVVHQLHQIGLTDYATAELKRIGGEAPSDPVLAFQLADLYVTSGETLRAIALLHRSFRNIIRHGGTNVPARFWEILYPRLYWEDITAAAQQAQQAVTDPYLISSIIRQESGFEPTVVSSAGAVGLMQIMPGEAPAIAARAGLANGLKREELFNPRINVTLGTAEFLQKLHTMNGNMILAIASYNAGEEAVGRWIAMTPIEDVDVFIDSIPFNETRLYVKNVLRNHHEYRRIYINASQS